jgi:Clp amino terminal domain, pathogenicity island component
MIRRLVDQHVAKVRDHRYGPGYNFGATYFDARDEAIRRGDRSIGTEHLVLALLVDQASPAAKAMNRDLDAARSALDDLDREALATIGVKFRIRNGPIAVRRPGRLRLTPAAKAVITNIRDAHTRKNRAAALAQVLDALLALKPPDPGAELLAALDVEAALVRKRFAELEGEIQP